MIGPKLKPGGELRIIAPALSLDCISNCNRQIAEERLQRVGFKVSYGKNVLKCDAFSSSSVDARLEDLHAAFADPSVSGILTVLGGYNSNQLLSRIDYQLIKEHPKFFCGYSDITALQNALLAQSGLVTYSGPHYSTFAMAKGHEYTTEGFEKAALTDGPVPVTPSEQWSPDIEWYLDQDNRTFLPNPGPQPIQQGSATGTIVGGNLGTFLLLKGTPYMPSLKNTILFLEEDLETGGRDVEFDRNLQSLIDLPDFTGVKGIVIGRFHPKSELDKDKLRTIIEQKTQLNHLPIACDFDFGHTYPMFTFPIGGIATLVVQADQVSLKFA